MERATEAELREMIALLITRVEQANELRSEEFTATVAYWRATESLRCQSEDAKALLTRHLPSDRLT